MRLARSVAQENPWMPWILLGLLSLIWGSSFILIKQGLKVYPADQVAAIRISAAFFALLPLAINRVRNLGFRNLKWLFISGIQGNFLPAFLFAYAQTRIESALAGILNALTPLFTLLIGVVLYRQKASAGKFIGVLVGLAGCIGLIVSKNGLNSLEGNVYALLVVVATVLYGSNVNILKFKLQHLEPMVTASIAMLLVGPLAVSYLFMGDFANRTAQVPGAIYSLGAIVLLGLLSTALALVLFNQLIKQSTTLFASSVTYLMPIVSLGWGFWIGERIGFIELMGMMVILAGVLIVHRAR
jgi:drug/metabolite transporter (DMT)-like permease